jgi:hypothetical protein
MHLHEPINMGFAPNQSMQPLPMVYEDIPLPTWEYHLVTVDLRESQPLDEPSITRLGSEGWLLAGVIQPDATPRLWYYFVRASR